MGRTSFHLIEQDTDELSAIIEVVELDGGGIGLRGEDGRVLFQWPKPGYVRHIEAYAEEMAAKEGYWLRPASPAGIDEGLAKPKRIPNPLGGNPAGEYEPEDLYPAEAW